MVLPIRPRRKIQLAHRGSDQTILGLIQLAELSHFGDAHVGVTDDVRDFEAIELTLESLS
jgi:hypothetical protein